MKMSLSRALQNSPMPITHVSYEDEYAVLSVDAAYVPSSWLCSKRAFRDAKPKTMKDLHDAGEVAVAWQNQTWEDLLTEHEIESGYVL